MRLNILPREEKYKLYYRNFRKEKKLIFVIRLSIRESDFLKSISNMFSIAFIK